MYTRAAVTAILALVFLVSATGQAAALDVDDDGLSLSTELDNEMNPLLDDTDEDGVTDGQELQMQTDPLRTDTDEDGLSDGAERYLNTDPTLNDTDEDGLTDQAELVEYGSNPTDATTVDNGLSDGEQVSFGLSPTTNPTIASLNSSVGSIHTERPFEQQSLAFGDDSDDDGYPDRVEQQNNALDPNKKDIVLRVQYMNGTAPNAASLLRVQQTYDNSPIDAGRGASLHFYVDGTTEYRETLDSEDYEAWYRDYANRGNGMFYVIYADKLSVQGENVAGYAFRGQPTFAVANDNQRPQTLTTAHELGHGLGLTNYVGIDSRNLTYEQYPSVMNYNSFADCEYRNRAVCTQYGSYDGRDDWAIMEERIENGDATPVGTYNTSRERNPNN